jgi:predicted phage terminase large subunit-like protein
MDLTPEQYETFLRQDLTTFIRKSFCCLHPGPHHYLHNWHIEVIAAELEKCLRGEINRLIINVPPRSLKSHCASIAFPAFILGHKPATEIICVSYGQQLAEKLAEDCRSVMTSKWYRNLFPRTQLVSNRQAVNDYKTTAHGSRLSTSIGGGSMGRGGDFIIIDDPLKPDEALSDAERKRVNDWYENTASTRLNDKKNGCIILIMQRLHEDDLVGHVLGKEQWKIIRFPAIAEEDERYEIQNVCGTKVFKRCAGEALHPSREPIEKLNQIRNGMGEYNFAGQYQQSPAPLGGGMVKTEWFKTYTDADKPAHFEQTFQSWDTANKPGELNDYSACTTWGVKEKHLYLLQVFRKQLGYPELKRAVSEQAQFFGPSAILIEDRASGTQLIQELISEGCHAVKKYAPTTDNKIMRMNAATPTIENGFVHVPDKAAWLGEYLHELANFPNGRYDDQVDSTSQALDWFKHQFFYGGWFEEMGKREMAKDKKEKSARVETKITRAKLLGRGSPSVADENGGERKKMEEKPDAPGPVTCYPNGQDEAQKPERPKPITWSPPETEED